MTHTGFYFIKSQKPFGFLRSLTAVSIDGVGKMPLRASIFPPGRIGCPMIRDFIRESKGNEAMKKLFVLVLWIITILIAFTIGQRTEKHRIDDKSVNNATVITETKTEQTSDKSIVEVPISDVESIATEQKNGITQKEAEELCREVLGEKAEENGFPISYRCISAVSANNKMYYVMHIAWLVDDNHWSYIGNCYVSSDGHEIYDGIVSSGKYEMTDLRWTK